MLPYRRSMDGHYRQSMDGHTSNGQSMKDSPTTHAESKRSPVVPDLIDIVEEWAMKMFKITKPGATVDHMDIVWNKLKFTSSGVHFENEKFEKDPGSQELLTTSFENNSDKTQYQVFEASETSTSTATTTLEKGFTRGDSGDIVLTVPDMIRAKASHFHNEIVINEDGRKTERTRKWKGKTSFDAIARKNTIVQMMILQEEYHCDFTMTETLRGTVIVNITGKIFKNPFTKTFQNPIATILEDRKELFPEYVTRESNHVVWPIKGHITFRYGVEVKIRYWYEDIQKAVEKSTGEAGLEEDSEEDGSQVEEDAPTTVDDTMKQRPPSWTKNLLFTRTNTTAWGDTASGSGDILLPNSQKRLSIHSLNSSISQRSLLDQTELCNWVMKPVLNSEQGTKTHEASSAKPS